MFCYALLTHKIGQSRLLKSELPFHGYQRTLTERRRVYNMSVISPQWRISVRLTMLCVALGASLFVYKRLLIPLRVTLLKKWMSFQSEWLLLCPAGNNCCERTLAHALHRFLLAIYGLESRIQLCVYACKRDLMFAILDNVLIGHAMYRAIVHLIEGVWWLCFCCLVRHNI